MSEGEAADRAGENIETNSVPELTPAARESLVRAIAADRRVSPGLAGGLADRYLAWRAELPHRAVESWEEKKAQRYIDGAWLWEGRPSVVFAGQGKGKSNFATWAIEKVLETRPTYDVYTTVPFPWDPDCDGPPEAEPLGRIHPVSSLSEVLRGAAESVEAGRVPAVIIDEMDQAVTSHNWNSEEARSWQRLVNIERHLRIRGPLLVYHAYRHVPIVLREGTMLKAMLQVIVKDGKHWVIQRDEEGFLNVPESVLPYLVYGLRGFDIDVDVQDLERHLNGSAAVVRKQLLEYLDRQEEGKRRREAETAEEFEADRQAVRALVYRRFEQGATVRQVAGETGIHRSTVGRLHVDWVGAKARKRSAQGDGP